MKKIIIIFIVCLSALILYVRWKENPKEIFEVGATYKEIIGKHDVPTFVTYIEDIEYVRTKTFLWKKTNEYKIKRSYQKSRDDINVESFKIPVKFENYIKDMDFMLWYYEDHPKYIVCFNRKEKVVFSYMWE